MRRLRPCRSPYTEVHSRLCTDFSFFGYARYQVGSCALRRLSAAVARLPLHCWRLWSRWLHWDQLRGSRRHPPHLLVELLSLSGESHFSHFSTAPQVTPQAAHWGSDGRMHAHGRGPGCQLMHRRDAMVSEQLVQQGDRLTMAKTGPRKCRPGARQISGPPHPYLAGTFPGTQRLRVTH